uniref:Protein cortex n=1 Tax=Trichogramma kaykai TaxID=54128 RepID=A0ABD2W4T1_9HYME
MFRADPTSMSPVIEPRLVSRQTLEKFASDSDRRSESRATGGDAAAATSTPVRSSATDPTRPRRLLVQHFDTSLTAEGSIATGDGLVLEQPQQQQQHQQQQQQQPQQELSELQASLRVQWPSLIERCGGADRFIPRRRGVSFDVSHYRHTHEDDHNSDGLYLDVFQEVKNATERWRRKYMDTAFHSLNIFDGMNCKRILNIGEASPSAEDDGCGSGSVCCGGLGCNDNNDECQWDARPRKYPLMSIKGETSKRYRDHGALIFRFAMALRYKHIIDWSSKNILAAGLSDTLCICDVDFKNMSKIQRVDYPSYLCAVKWNEAGNRVATSTMDGFTTLYDSDLRCIVWSRKCPCYRINTVLIETRCKCRVVCALWAREDKHIITGCDSGCVLILRSSNGSVLTQKNFDTELLALSLSPKEQFLVLSCADKLVKVFDYPSLTQLFEIAFFASVRAFAWHPWSSGILCIGGGPGDASLSLWNVNSQRQLGYRKVHFVGSVDSMLFNKLSGELLVHWYYLEGEKLRSKIAVLAGLNRIVDAVPIQPEHRMLNIVWSPDHTKLAVQHRDTLVIWNFFGSELNKWNKSKKRKHGDKSASSSDAVNYCCLDTQTRTGPHTSLASARRGKNFSHYNIR